MWLKVSGLSRVRNQRSQQRRAQCEAMACAAGCRPAHRDRRHRVRGVRAVDAGGDTLVVARVRPRSGVWRRCGRCGRRAPWYDRGEGRRRWRGLDWGTVQVVLEADAPRMNCPEHRPTVVAVPWARHHAGHTYSLASTATATSSPSIRTAPRQRDMSPTDRPISPMKRPGLVGGSGYWISVTSKFG